MECAGSAMVVQTLGSSVDIYCGGADNLVRHHDYTLAVVEAVSGKPLARYWLHGAHLLVNGDKMSKSKGNVIYTDDLQKAGYTGEQIRFCLIYGHYRKRLNFTWDKINKTSLKLKQINEMIDCLHHTGAGVERSADSVTELILRLQLDFTRNMDDDLNVKPAFDELFHTLTRLTRLAKQKKITAEDAESIIATLDGINSVLQVFNLPL